MLLLVALCVIVPIVELAAFLQVAHWIGPWEALLALLVISLLGAWMVKVQGIGVVRRVSGELRERRVPGRSLVDGGLIVVAGILLLVPGFVTAVLGILLLIPMTRAPVRELLVRRWTRRYPVRIATYASSRWTAVDADSSEGAARSEPKQLGRERAIEPPADPDGIL